MTELMKLIDERIKTCEDYRAQFDSFAYEQDLIYLRALKTALVALYDIEMSPRIMNKPEEIMQGLSQKALTQIETQMKGEVGE